jgi:hypothetical protein
MVKSRSSHGCLRVLVIATALAALWAAAPPMPEPAVADCGRTVTFEQTAREPRASMFTGHAVRELDNGWSVLFEVDRWYKGAHPARFITFDGTLVVLREPPAAGIIAAITARTTAGDAIGLVRGQDVFMVAYGPGEDGRYTPDFCGIGAVALGSAEGRAYLRRAIAIFGAGRPASELPATDAADGPAQVDVPRGIPWQPLVAFIVGVAAALRRLERSPRAKPDSGVGSGRPNPGSRVDSGGGVTSVGTVRLLS